MSVLHYIIIANLGLSLLSLVGIFALTTKESFLNKILIYLIGLSTGTLLGGAFIHLLPEGVEIVGIRTAFNLTLVSFTLFYVLEKILHWHHCHDADCPDHTFGYMNLVGDAIHNFIDGLIIAGSFIINPTLGLTTTIALAFHELPQEIGDFGVLIYSGMSKGKALFYNFFVALTSVLGGVVGYYFISSTENVLGYLLPVAAGGFIYISTSDLLPEIRSDSNTKRSIITFLLFLGGLVLMYLISD